MLSKNNDDDSLIAQAVFLRPSASATAQPEPEPAQAGAAEKTPDMTADVPLKILRRRLCNNNASALFDLNPR